MILSDGLFHFLGKRCPDGYELGKARKLPEKDADYCELVGSKSVTVIRPRTERIVAYVPAKDDINLHHILRELNHDSASVLEFTNQFGFLTDGVTSYVNEMSINVAHSISDSLKKTENLDALSDDDHLASINSMNQFHRAFGLEKSRFMLSLEPRRGKYPEISIVPTNLANYIILLAASEFCGDVEWKKCANPKCESMFRIARGRGAISDKNASTVRKRTCSDACRKTLQRIREKEKSDE
ncbi:MAG: hypothetical protein HON14_00380 [Rhodospirillaceae bacterium]|nr:hypothetical protein [Rhodospirillaceae bacterium]MBT6220973.1 hypothetical protein [Rhodospirillaceae bacterium]MBT7485202.1 hypothetical protein [Rhodospirillales bacterium]